MGVLGQNTRSGPASYLAAATPPRGRWLEFDSGFFVFEFARAESALKTGNHALCRLAGRGRVYNAPWISSAD